MIVWKSYDWNYEIPVVSILYEKYMYDPNCFNILLSCKSSNYLSELMFSVDKENTPALSPFRRKVLCFFWESFVSACMWQLLTTKWFYTIINSNAP